jgi:hypothetical protein
MPSVRTVAIALTLCTLVGAACSSTTTYRRPTTPTEAKQILAQPGNSETELVVESAQGPHVRKGVLTPFDAQRFVVTDPSGQRSTILFQDTRSIAYKEHGKSALVGFLIGALPGFISGMAAGSMLGDCHAFGANEDKSCSGHSLSTGLGMGAVAGLVTGGIGAAIGAAIGHKTTITF